MRAGAFCLMCACLLLYLHVADLYRLQLETLEALGSRSEEWLVVRGRNSRSAGAAAPEGYAGGSAGLKSTVGQLLSCVGQVRQHFRNTAVNGSCYGNAPVVFGWQVLACFTFVLMQGTPIEA